MPQTLRSLNRLFNFDPLVESIRVDLTRQTVRCEIMRPDADTKQIIEHESKNRGSHDDRFFTTTAIDSAVYELRLLLNFGVRNGPKKKQYDQEAENAKTLERLKHIRDIQSIKALDGYEIRSLREALMMSYDEFARALGCSTATIFRWETGKGRISNSFAMHLLNVMRQSNLDLGWADPTQPSETDTASETEQPEDWNVWPPQEPPKIRQPETKRK